ncbi:MAG TPA: hypothetical protein VF032_18320 [Thermoleophilaceae bacterium]
MTWVAWRLQRTETLIMAGVLALLMALLIPSGIQMASAYHHDGVAACIGAAKSSPACGNVLGNFLSRFEPIRNATIWLTLLPGLIGVSFAAPLVLDLEHGTHRLAWTQSITRRRWLAGKIGVAVVAALLSTLALALLLIWWRTPFRDINGRIDPSEYDAEGIVAYGYTLFALGLAMAIGVLWRRAVPAVVVAFLGYFGLRIFVDAWLRERLISPVSTTWSNSTRGPNLQNAWVLSQTPSDRFGNAIAVRPEPCGPGILKPGGPHVACFSTHGASYSHAVYHPASHFWPLQSVETAMFGGAALLLMAFAAWWTHERVA